MRHSPFKAWVYLTTSRYRMGVRRNPVDQTLPGGGVYKDSIRVGVRKVGPLMRCPMLYVKCKKD